MPVTNRVRADFGGLLRATLEDVGGPLKQRLLPLVDHRRLSGMQACPAGNRCTPYSAASSDTVRSPFTASSANRALKPASWFGAFPHGLISSVLETGRRQIVASVTVPIAGSAST
jgi:hypothetical protein